MQRTATIAENVATNWREAGWAMWYLVLFVALLVVLHLAGKLFDRRERRRRPALLPGAPRWERGR